MQSGATTTVRQKTETLSLNWQSFNVASNEYVNFVQPNSSAIAVNRILGNTGSQILGHLNANGQVWLINPNGILFGQGAQVNVGGLVASALNVNDVDLSSNFRVLSGNGTGSIVNKGSIQAASGGYVALIGNKVINEGTVSAQLGTVALGAGSAETLTFSGKKLIHLTVDKSTLDNLVENQQLIQADGGRVIMTAGAQDALLKSVVNNTGVVEARSVENHDGSIVLLAGMRAGQVDVGGTLDASAETGNAGGSITTSAASLSMAPKSKITAGAGGSWLIDPFDLSIDANAATSIVAALNSGTSVTEQTTATTASGFGNQTSGSGSINVNAAITWTNPAAALTLSAYDAINVNAPVNGAGAVNMQATNGNLTIAPGASVVGNTGVTLATGANFFNNAGAGAVSTGAGAQWLVYSTNPTSNVAGALTPDFLQYAAPFGTSPAQVTGNGFLYSVAPSLAVSALAGATQKVYDGGTASSLTAANYTITGLLNGDAVASMGATYGSADAGSNIDVTSASSAANLTVTSASGALPVYGYALTGAPVTASIGTITPAPLSAAIVGNPTKVYDSSRTATLTSANYGLSGLVAGQSITVNQPSSVSYGSASAGSQTVTAGFGATNFAAGSGTRLANYSLPTSASGTGTVTQAPLIITGVLATNKVYDSTTADPLDTSQAGLYGTARGDVVTLSTAGAVGTFAASAPANNVAVTTAGFALTGAQQADYMLVQPTGLAAKITPANLTITGVAATNKVYNGNATDPLNSAGAALSGIVGGDAATLMLSASGAAGTFGSKNAGTGLGVTATGYLISGASALNYTLIQPTGLTADITPATLAVALTGNPTKPYNGTTTAVTSSANFSLTGFVAGEGATIPQTVLAVYGSANAGAQTVTVSLAAPDIAPSGSTLLSNYTIPSTVSGLGTITPAPLTGVVVGNPTKVYDSTASATLTSDNYALSGFQSGQGATVSQPNATYATPNVGLRAVTATVTPANYAPMSGTLLSNYSLPTTLTGTGTINPAVVTGQVQAAIIGNPSKPYDGTTTATLTPGSYSLAGFIAGQGATVTQSIGQYATPNAGLQTITAALSPPFFSANAGTNLSNYTLPTTAYGAGTISPITLNVAVVNNPTRVYNGSTSMTLLSSNYSITGFIGSEGAQINPSALINYGSANAGAQSITASLTPSAYTANSGTLMSNYNLASSASGMGTITAAPLFITGVYATNKVYNTSAVDPLNTSAEALAGLVGSDMGNVNIVGTAAGSFATAHAGTGLPVTVTGLSINGSAASNYTLQALPTLTAKITPAPLSIAGVSANSRAYDGTNSATLDTASETLSGVLGSDTVLLSAAGAVATFNSIDVGSNLKVNASGFAISSSGAADYLLAQPSSLSANITQAPITAVITGNPTKVYDGATSTTLTAASYTLVGFAPGQGASVPQSATAAYGAPDAGVGVAVGSTLVIPDFTANAGTNLSNYLLPATGSGTGTITQATLTANIVGNPTKSYNGTPEAVLAPQNYGLYGFVGSQSATVTQTSGAYSTANAGIQPVSATLATGNYAAGSATNLDNYVLPTTAAGTGTIASAALTLSGVTTTPRAYDGTTIDALTGATLSGTFYGSDMPVLTNYTTGILGNSGNAGTDSVTTNIGLTGTGSANYTITQPSNLTALISPAALGASSSVTKTYTGTTSASLSGANTTFTGFVTGQGATVNAGVTGTFQSSNVATGINVTGVALTTGNVTANSGTLLSNYSLPASDNGTGSITPAQLTYVATPSSQTYGITPTGLSGSVDGFVNGESLASATTGTSAFSTSATSQSNVGHYAINGSGLTANNGNYLFVQAVANATALNVTAAPLTVINVVTTDRLYNGSTSDALTGATLSGTLYNGDLPVLTNYLTGVLGNSGNVGTDSVTTSMGLSGPGSSNYSITQPLGLTAVIYAAQLSATSTATKFYDGTTVASLSGANTVLTGFVAGQGATVKAGVTGTFASPNAGGNIAITGGALSAGNLTPTGGAVLSNYLLPSSDNGIGTISKAVVSLMGTRIYNAATDAAAGIFGAAGAINTGVNAETLALSGSGTLVNKNVSTTRALSSLGTLSLSDGTGGNAGAASNYTLTGGTDTVNVTPLGLTVTATANSKTYSGTTAATLATLGSSGVIPGDTVTFAKSSALFNTKDVATANTVTISGITKAGIDTGNYTLNNTSTTAAATITPAIVSLSGTRVYDADVDAAASIFGAAGTVNTGVNAETLALSGSSTTVSKDVGSRALSNLGTFTLGNGTGGNGGTATNYTLIGGTDAVNVTAATLTYNAAAAGQFYGVTHSGLTGTVSGFVGSDTLGTATAGTAAFNTAAIATSNVGQYAINGSGLTANNGDYSFVQASGNATALTINKAIVNLTGTRVYTGLTTAAANIFGTAGTVSTGVSVQTLVLGGSGTLASKDVGSRSVSLPGSLTLSNGSGGGLASNYTLTGGIGTVNVTAATLTYNATAVSQPYGVTPSGLTGTLTGFVNGETLAGATTGTAAFTTTVGATSNVSQYAITGSGLTANNNDYNFVQAAGNATALTISKAVVNLSGTRVYDALLDANAAIFGTAGTVSGANGETLNLSGGGTLAGKNVGSRTVSALGTLVLNNGTGGSGGLASNYTLIGGTDAVNVTTLGITVAGTANNKIYDGSTAATVATLGSTGVISGDTVTFAKTSATFNTKDVATATMVTIGGITDGGADAGNYTLNNTSTTAAANITPAIVSLSGARVYDADVDAAASIFGIAGTINTGVNAETLALSGSGTLVNKNVSTTRALSSLGTLSLSDGTGGNAGAASNYTLTGGTDTVNVIPLGLTVTATANSKTYSGTTAATLATLGSSGVIPGDTVTFAKSSALFNTKDVATANTVTISGITKAGIDTGNYTLNNTSTTAAATITPAIVNLSGARAYDVNVDAAASIFGAAGTVMGIDTETLALSGVGTLAGKNVGSQTVSALGTLALNNGAGGGLASNYTLTGGTDTVNLGTLGITVTGTANNKTYDGNTTATVATLGSSGVLNGDTVTFANTTAAFNTKDVVTANTVTIGGITDAGADAGNYTLNNTGTTAAAAITPAVVNLSGARVYDANVDAAASIFGIAGTVTGINAETLALSGGGTLAGKNVGSQTVSALGSLALNNGTGGAGGLASNYTLTGGTDTVNVGTLGITVAGTANNKTYDGNTTATVATLGSSGVLTGDTVTFANGSATFNTKDVVTANTVTIGGITDAGADAGNYTLNNTSTTAAANITPAVVNLSGARAYDADVDAAASIFGTAGTIAGVNVETLALSGSSTLVSKNVGSRALTSLGSLTLGGGTGGSGGLASNYTLTGGTDTVNVGTLGITVAGTANNKTYDGNTTATVATLGSSGVLTGDTVTFANTTAAFNTKDVVTANTVTIGGITDAGADAGNYTLNNTTVTAAANITPAIVNLSGARPYDADVDAAASIFGASGMVNTAVNSETLALSGAGTIGSKIVGSRALTSLGSLILGDGVGGTGGLASNYMLTGGTDTVNVGTLGITVAGTANNKTYDGNTTATVATLGSSGVLNGDAVTFANTTAAFNTKDVVTANTVTIGGITDAGADASNYTLNNTSATAAASITPVTVSLSGARAYDASVDAAASIFGAAGTIMGINTETLALSGVGTLAGKNVGSQTVSALGTLALNNGAGGGQASNYALTGGTDTVNVGTLGITVTGTANNKTYDGNTTATVATLGSSGVLTGDTVTFANGSATFNTKDVVTANTVTIGGITGAGADAGNYTLNNTSTTAAANITPAIVSLNGARTYDASVDAAANLFGAAGTIMGINTETLALSGVGTLAGKNVGSQTVSALGSLTLNNGTGGAGALASNYTLTGGTDTVNVGTLGITVTGTGNNKTYDGTVADAVTLASTGVISGDSVTFASSTAAFKDKTVGTGKAVSISGIILSGVDSRNYSLNNVTAATTANITPLGIIVTGTGSNKVYDGTITDAVTLTSTGVLAGDSVTFADTSAAFGDKNVGIGKTVTVSGVSAAGADSGNYSVNSVATASADITPAKLIETANTVAAVSAASAALSGRVSGFVPGDTVGNSTTGSLAWTTDAPAQASPGLYAINGSGLVASNYVITQAPTNANALSITAAPEVGATQTVAGLAVAGLIGLPLSADKIATPYGIGSGHDYSNNTGNAKTGEDPIDTRSYGKFTPHLALRVVEGGVRMPDDSTL